MMTPTATVFVIDDDEAVRKSLGPVVKKAEVPPLVRHTTKVS